MSERLEIGSTGRASEDVGAPAYVRRACGVTRVLTSIGYDQYSGHNGDERCDFGV
jgi:hypothetical protein